MYLFLFLVFFFFNTRPFDLFDRPCPSTNDVFPTRFGVVRTRQSAEVGAPDVRLRVANSRAVNSEIFQTPKIKFSKPYQSLCGGIVRVSKWRNVSTSLLSSSYVRDHDENTTTVNYASEHADLSVVFRISNSKSSYGIRGWSVLEFFVLFFLPPLRASYDKRRVKLDFLRLRQPHWFLIFFY